MKNSHKITIFIASLMTFARARAIGQSAMPAADGMPTNSEELLSSEEMKDLLDRGVLQYDPNTNAVHIRIEDAKKLTVEKKAAWIIKSIRHVFGPDVKIRTVPTKDMQLASQDRQK